MRWSAEKNEFGAPGLFASESGKKGKGSHGSLSRFDMHNTLVATGPDFKSGLIDELPTGMSILRPPFFIFWVCRHPRHGRPNSAGALAAGEASTAKPVTKTIEASHDVGAISLASIFEIHGIWRDRYFDEGNGEPVPK